MSEPVIVAYKASGLFKCNDCNENPEWEMHVNNLYATCTWTGTCKCNDKEWSAVIESVKIKAKEKGRE